MSLDPAKFSPENFIWEFDAGVATIRLNRPERKNPLTFESYAELRDTFRELLYTKSVNAVVLASNEGNFSSGGDVHEIIGPLTKMTMRELLAFTRMTGDLVKAIRACPQIVVAAIDGICVGAGACIALGCDLRYGTPGAKIGFIFARVGLAGCDMGACALLPRVIGHGRAAELFYSGRMMGGEEAHAWGFLNALLESGNLLPHAQETARTIARGPHFAHAMTKRQLDQEWSMPLAEAIESEAQAQAICMQTDDFRRAYDAFVEKRTPEFGGT